MKDKQQKPLTAAELVLVCLKKKIPVSSVELVGEDKIGYKIPGFSKSGEVVIYDGEEGLEALARYNKKYVLDEYDEFNSLVTIAWDWFVDYRDRSPFDKPDSIWLPHFVERGWITVQIEQKPIYQVSK